jgi:ATP:ADP antiporter, AAA family
MIRRFKKNWGGVLSGIIVGRGMLSTLKAKLGSIWGVKKEHLLKVFYLTSTFFLFTGCQAIWRPLKTSVFATIVGKYNVPRAKLLVILPIIFLILIYSKLVDVLRRHQLLYCFALFHGICGIILYFFLKHPVYGIANTDQSSYRIFGWVFYLFLESFGAFMSATFWAFANSINNPKDSKNYYGIFVSGSKVGGIIFAGLLYILVTYSGDAASVVLPNSLLIGSVLLLLGAYSIYLLMKNVPGYYMHGYEVAYKAEKQRSKEEKKKKIGWVKQSLEGIVTIVKTPYVLGIFSMIAFYEIIIVVMDYIVLLVASSSTNGPSELTGYYALYYLGMHSVGLIIAFFGTVPLQRFLGIRRSVLVPSILAIGLLAIALVFPTAGVLFAILVVLRAINYGLNHPTREALYVPTTKAIKFKAKAWTDAFGSRFSKAVGSVFNIVTNGLVAPGLIFGLGLASVWLVVSNVLGKSYQKAIDEKRVIGEEADTES